MGRIICVANQKGGVGKTTTAVNLAVGLAKSGARTLLVDLDPQCNTTTGLGLTPAARHPLILEDSLRQSLRETYQPGLFLLPGSRAFQDIQRFEQSQVDTAVLGQHLASGMTDFEYVLIDCPPSLGHLTQTALASAHEVFMPIQCEYYAMEGLTQMIEVIRALIDKGAKLEFGGVILTMFDPRLELTWEVDHEVRDFFGEIVFRTVIPRDVAVAEAPSHGYSVIDYAPRGAGARAYVELCMEVLNRE